MCNLYSLTPKHGAVARFFRVSHNRTVAFEPLNTIFPRYVAPVVRQSADGGREIVMMSWGFMRLEKGKNSSNRSQMLVTIRCAQTPSGAIPFGSAAAWYRPPPSTSRTVT